MMRTTAGRIKILCFAGLLFIAIFCVLIPSGQAAATHYAGTWEELRTAVANVSEGGTIYITSDITVTLSGASITVYSGKDFIP